MMRSQVLVIWPRHDHCPSPIDSIIVGSSNIRPVEAARNIGVVFDKTHQFKRHIISTCQSIFMHIQRIGRIRKYLSKKTCLKLVYSVLSAKLDYCNALLNGLPNTQLRLLQRAQNAAARLITRSKKFDHISPILKQLHWLPVNYRIQFKILLLTYKAINGLAPPYIAELIEQYKPSRSLRSSDKLKLKIPRTKLKSYGDRSFAYSAPQLWNQLPHDVCSAPTVENFKAN